MRTYRQLLAAVAVAAFPAVAEAQLFGSTYQLDYIFGPPGNVIMAGGTATVGPAVEFPGDFLGFNDIDITQNTISFSIAPLTGFSFEQFNGIRLIRTGGTAEFFDVANAATTGYVLDPSRIVFDGTSVAFNFQGLDVSPTGPIVFDVGADVSAVPEPATWALVGAGLASLGVGARRRRA